MIFYYILAFFVSFLLCFMFTPLVLKIVRKFGIVTKSNLKKEDKDISCLGSLAIYLSFIITVAVVAIFKSEVIPELKGILIGATWILLIGLIDDLKELSPFFKFAGQIIGVLIIILFGVNTKIIFIPHYLNLFVTAVWILGITNAFNLLDILDGLSIGLAVIASLTFLVTALFTNNPIVGIITAALAGSGFAFLKYNFPPARIFMGDGGSLFIGFTLASCAIAISYAPSGREIALLTPIFILGLPIYDTFFVILMRFLRRKSVVRKSRDHFALRMLAAGFSEKKTLYLMWLFGCLFSGSALIISKVSNQMGISILGLVILISLIIGKSISEVVLD